MKYFLTLALAYSTSLGHPAGSMRAGGQSFHGLNVLTSRIVEADIITAVKNRNVGLHSLARRFFRGSTYLSNGFMGGPKSTFIEDGPSVGPIDPMP